jgi:hypothetical protein
MKIRCFFLILTVCVKNGDNLQFFKQKFGNKKSYKYFCHA